jgi:GPH family glycoside/pentoside/hexuronide:cation symporter
VASFATLRVLFLGIFLADVVGLNLRLVSIVLLVGLIWDAVNDLFVGAFSDRVQTRWGRRRPFLLWFSIPFGLSFLLIWIAPPWDSQIALLLHVTIAYIISDTLFTLVSLPFYALTPELTPDYDERTSLATFRMLFNLVASLVTAVAAPQIIRSAATPRAGYTAVALIFGVTAAFPFLAIFAAARERGDGAQAKARPSLFSSLKAAWRNVPFRFATAIHLLNWIAVDLLAFMLPFYVVYWLESGQQRPMLAAPVVGSLAVESAIFGLHLAPAALALPLWRYLARRIDKHKAYIVGSLVWLIAQFGLLLVQPGERWLAFGVAFVAGVALSAAHVLPDAIFPDVMEWDELMTGQQRIGVFYGIRTFLRKVATAGALAVASQVLGLSGYQSPPPGTAVFTQTPTTLFAIRTLAGGAVIIFLFSAAVIAYFYPLTRERHERVRRLLARRKERAASAAARNP